ncbi:MAG: tetratricopeptide repeat protein [Treponema sp.]|jgi:tetratricopeptide (TPR) repeat protein|nr:tetratricopeptide repeat protein [Treponema sp.]
MINNKSFSRYGRNIYLLKKIKAISLIAVIILAAVISVSIIINSRSGSTNEKRELIRVWNAGEYENAYEISKNALDNNPVDYFFLAMNGFSSYQLGVSQINNQNMVSYIDECIFSLRKAMLLPNSKNDARLYYVLGKAYGYKGTEYSDLAIKYLSIAEKMSYEANDIPEYLGLAYAASGDFRSSIEAFTKSFDKNSNPSDNLLLSISRSYIAMEDYNLAMGYLRRCIESSPDSKSINVARLLLAEVFMLTGEYDNAEEQYLIILSEGGENAEVRFQLGEFYNLKGDTTRARSEWRIAYRQDPAHAKARARLNI